MLLRWWCTFNYCERSGDTTTSIFTCKLRGRKQKFIWLTDWSFALEILEINYVFVWICDKTHDDNFVKILSLVSCLKYCRFVFLDTQRHSFHFRLVWYIVSYVFNILLNIVSILLNICTFSFLFHSIIKTIFEAS